MNPAFRTKVQLLLARLSELGFQPKVFYGWRSIAVQTELYKKGRTKVRFSFHNAQLPDGTPNAYAADIIDRRYAWENKPEAKKFFETLGVEAKKLGLIWGGAWKSFPDEAHVQFYDNEFLAKVKKQSGL